jgi:hypothetical protein
MNGRSKTSGSSSQTAAPMSATQNAGRIRKARRIAYGPIGGRRAPSKRALANGR